MQWLLRASLMASGVAGLLIQPTNITLDGTDVDLALPLGNSIAVYGSLEPLTMSANSLPTNGVSDQLFHVTTQNQNSLSSRNIALISCDARDYPGFTSLNDVFQTALGVNSTAIILYSLTAQQCNISGLESAFSKLYSMSNRTTSYQLLDHISGGNNVVATVLHSDSSYLRSNGSSSTRPASTYGSSPTTAVAMIILYSVTGIITALFLIIIITGAVRAHRHPERYGPRNVLGRPRQTRARGIARAMLDTIPVVKFGEHQAKHEPKPTDIELADSDTPVIRRSVEITETGTHDQSAPRRSMASARSGIGAAAGHIDTSDAIAGTNLSQSSEALGCSICTDDFETGQDIRVLPCDHKFHPACIDPWLLNVSSTCPLCRVDLRPEGSAEAEAAATAASENAELPPPINGYNGQPYRVSMRRSLLIGLGLDRGHVDQQQRMAAARELSANNPDGTPEAVQQQEQGEEGRQRRRLRERFGIRTRRRGQSDAQAPVVTVPEEASTDTPPVVEVSDEQRDHRPANSS